MRPSVQKTLLIALGAALLSSALGVSGAKVGATAKAPPVRIVVLPGQASGAGALEGDVGRLLREARFKRLVGEFVSTEAGATGSAVGAVPAFARAELVERVRRRLLAEPGPAGR